MMKRSLVCLPFFIALMVSCTGTDTDRSGPGGSSGMADSADLVGVNTLQPVADSGTYYDGQFRGERKTSTVAYVEQALLYRDSGDFVRSVKYASLALNTVEDDEDSLKIRIFHLLSGGFEGIGAYTEAITHSIAAYDLLKQQKSQAKHRAIFFNAQRVGGLYLELNLNDSAMIYFKESRDFALASGNLKQQVSALNNIGLAHFWNGQIDSAKTYYYQALTVCEQFEPRMRSDSLLETLIKGNLAECLGNDDPLKEAYLKEDIARSIHLRYDENAILSSNELGLVLMQQQRNREARDVLEKARSLADSTPSLEKTTHLELISYLIQVYVNLGDRSRALEYHEVQNNMIAEYYGKKEQDRLLQELTTLKLAKINDEIKIEKIRAEKDRALIENLSKENDLVRVRNWSLVIFSALLVVLFVLIHSRNRADNRRKNKEKELQNQLLELELELNSERLNASVQSLSRKKKFVKDFIDRFMELDNIDDGALNSLKLFALNEIDVDDSILKMEEQINEIGEKQIARLKYRYPELSNNDLELLGYIRMKLTNKQIATIKNVTADSVKKAKNRLRKKLDLPPGHDFESILNS